VAAVIEDGVDGLLTPPGDPAALAQAISRLLADAGECRRLGEASRQATLERDTWARAASATLAAYGVKPRPA
jgi:glycosyltransferase involved in cell wall biosynthesis